MFGGGPSSGRRSYGGEGKDMMSELALGSAGRRGSYRLLSGVAGDGVGGGEAPVGMTSRGDERPRCIEDDTEAERCVR
jgi:hypothetical protein